MKREDLEKERESNLERRMSVMDPYSKLWDDNCRSCRLIADAVDAGTLPKGTTKDRQNDICVKCPVQKELWEIGDVLEETMKEEQRLRKLKTELFEESKKDRLRRMLSGEYDNE